MAGAAENYDPKREVRVGLVLYGGVALAIYINGVTVELLRLVEASRALEQGKPTNAYADLLRAAQAKFTVDIISGASAGGINGVALGKALCTGANMDDLKHTWRYKADLGALLNPKGRRDAPALLSEDYYEGFILSVLNNMDEQSRGKKPLVNVLDVFLTTTDLHGRVSSMEDYLGQEIDLREHKKAFHLKFRTSGYNSVDKSLGYDRNDFAPRHNEVLARACRATSAFPVAFRPMALERPRDELLFDDGEPELLHLSDGGILNNKPFSDTIKTIFSREADVPVDRILLYVEPDPGTIGTRPVPSAPKEPTFLEVATKAASSLPMHQSIAADLRSIEDRSRRIRKFNSARQHLQRELSRVYGAQLDEARDRDSIEDPSGRSAYRDVLGGTGVQSSYDDLKVEETCADVAWRLRQVLGLDASDQNHRQVLDLILDEVKAQCDAGEKDFMRAFDTAFRGRRYYHLIELLDEFTQHRDVAQLLEATVVADDGAEPAPLRDAVQQEGRRLWACLEHVRDLEWKTWTLDEKGWFHKEHAELRRLREEPVAKIQPQLHSLLTAMGRRLIDEFGKLHEQGRDATIRIDQILGQVLESLAADSRARPAIPFVQAFEQFEFFDMFLYPMSSLADLGERDPIEWVRISPVDAKYLTKGPEDKLAGDAVFHFGGFLKESWRANDILWGRLDAADLLVHTLLKKAGVADAEMVPHIERIQEEIVREELGTVVTSVPGFSYKRYMEQEHRVGEEGIEDIARGKLASMAVQGAHVFKNMLRTIGDDRTTFGIVAWVSRKLAQGLSLLLGFIGPIVEALFADSSLLRRAHVIVFVGLWSWGFLTLLLWLTGPLDLPRGVTVLGVGALLPLSIYSWVRSRRLGVLFVVLTVLGLAAAFATFALPTAREVLASWADSVAGWAASVAKWARSI